MKKLVVLTGSGISAESGLKTFRDQGGLWEGYDLQKVATPEAWERDPEMVLDFYNKRRQGVRNARPNAAHKALVKLEDHYEVTIITQNIDDLHERAGSSNVIHLHGEIMKARSNIDDEILYDLGGGDIKMGDKCELGSQLRPHVVWFGEPVPMIEKAMMISSQADIYLVIGTSLVVYPAAGLIHYAPSLAKKYLVDPKAPELTSDPNLEAIQANATTGVEPLVYKLIENAEKA